MAREKQIAAAFVAEIDEAELALRFAEIAIGMKRPPGKTAAECMDDFKFRAAMAGPEAMKVANDMHAMARAAVLYLHECIKNGRKPS